MKRLRNVLFTALLTAVLFCLFSSPAFAAVTESDIQSQVAAAGKEAVSGNVLIWFLCAVSFLKISQKIDSFMASLGVNVGHTGGSMMAEALIATRGLSTIRNSSSKFFGGGNSSSSHRNSNSSYNSGSTGAGFMSGGLSGIVSRSVQNSAVKTATSSPDTKSSGGIGGIGGNFPRSVGGHMYTNSLSRGGDFANNVIGSVATGNIASAGSISGEKAADALQSYMGNTALGNSAEHIPSFSDVQIGGGRITGNEVSEEHPDGAAFGMYHTDQFNAPTGAYTTVSAADGTSWYKQYAADTVEKSPYMAPDGSIAYHESIVKKLPPAPHRKDRI